jgi:hypothetical protein
MGLAAALITWAVAFALMRARRQRRQAERDRASRHAA